MLRREQKTLQSRRKKASLGRNYSSLVCHVPARPRSYTLSVQSAFEALRRVTSWGICLHLKRLWPVTMRRGKPIMSTGQCSIQSNSMISFCAIELRSEKFSRNSSALRHGSTRMLQPYVMPYLHVIQWVWPDALFIFARRRPVDFIFSARSKFPDRSLKQLCQHVAFTFSNWEKQKSRLKRYIEIDQSELSNADALADKLLTFLQFDQKKRPKLVENLRFEVERTATSYAPHELADLKLTPEQTEMFNGYCGPIIDRYYKTEV